MTLRPRDEDVRKEQVLARQLSAAQQVMMALGGAIGTGLFLASGLSVNVARPAIIVAYGLVAVIALLPGRALTAMAVAHPTAGAFGVYAGMYVSPFAGYAVRVSYWLMQVIATGGQLVAASIYMGYWFPAVPGALWVFVFAAALIYVNSRAVGKLGRIEYWLVTIKVVAVTLLVALTPWSQLGIGESPFVSVLRRLAIPGAAGVMNLVVLVAALSSANANIYLIARTLFSLARAGFVPHRLGEVSESGAPVAALLVSAAGLAAAVIVRALWPQSTYVWSFGAALS